MEANPRNGTVSRGAFVAGWIFGIAFAVAAYYTIEVLSPEGWWKPLVELVAMALAMGITFGTWSLSARFGAEVAALDSEQEAQDRETQGD